MGYGGYLIKVGDYKIPFNYIIADTFQSPLLGQDKDSYNDDDGLLHRTALPYQVIKTEWQTPPMDEKEMRPLMDKIIEQYTIRREKKCMVTTWCPEIGKYVSMNCYVPDVKVAVGFADENNISYNGFRIAFIGYGGKIL